jgi:hypothetical protein
LIGYLGNESFDRLFLNCSTSAKEKNLIELKKESRIDFESTDVSVLSIEALDSLVLNESISAESEDSLLKNILKLGFVYRDLLRHIRMEFLSEDGLSLLSEYFDIPPESVFELAVERITIFSSSSAVVRFANHFRHSRNLRRVRGEAIFGSVAGQSRWFQCFRISRSM